MAEATTVVPMDLDGLFVEIVGSPEPAGGESGEPQDLNSEKGRVLYWDSHEQRYMVQLFSGYTVPVDKDHLQEYDPEDSEMQGGFDVAWPAGTDSHGIFASMISQTTNTQGYCVVQTFFGDAEEARWMSKGLSWGILKGDVEEEYLGQDVTDGKVAWMQYRGVAEGEWVLGMRPMQLEQLQADMRMDYYAALDRCDLALTNLAALMFPLTMDWEDDLAVSIWGRTSGMVRSGFESGDPEGIRNNVLGFNDSEDFENHAAFLSCKKLCLMYFVDNEGGELLLTPNNEAYSYNDVSIPLSKNKIVVFRCDAMGFSYTYKPVGRNFSLTTWLLETPPEAMRLEEKLRQLDVEEPTGARTHAMSVMTRYPGCGFTPQAYWTMFTAASDGQVEVPIMRWDIDIYYRKDHTFGFSMTKHGALVQQSEVEWFDNKFFGIPDEEVVPLDPYQRCMLEIGYECLARAGHRREQMKGWQCGVFVGDSGSDWNGLHGWQDKRTWPPSCRYKAAARLSCIMGLTGPISTSETACSSSLVANGLAQMTMRRKLPDQKKNSIAVQLNDALVIGTNLLLGPGGYIGLSGPQLLTSLGRCFTFDQSADGYARGEGIGAVKWKVCDNPVEFVNRLAVLVGSAVNQDGRSASLTAPNGPSQQDVIKQSMREGGLVPSMSTVAECHGTGTALGDPIEVGALQAVMKADRGPVPILKTTAKSNIGHLEASAGVAGLIKCIMMLNYCFAQPNLHLLNLNPHLDVEGYPVYFETEAVDFMKNAGLSGVSSFGFGGTNARGDVWGHGSTGQHYSISGIQPRSLTVLS